ncbi:MAG: hypothetical protein ACFE95_18190 [Candidatus Hodarchaeota archaeon]
MLFHIYNLNCTVKKSSSIESIQFHNPNFVQEDGIFYCSINFSEIISVEFLNDSVLVVKYRNGEIRLDISRSQLAEALRDDEKT